MSRWNHALCEEDYDKFEPGRQPSVMAYGYRQVEICCECGIPTTSGIYYRHDPELMACGGLGHSD